MQRLVSVLSLAALLWVVAASGQAPAADDVRYVADIELQNSEQLVGLLERASELFLNGAVTQDGVPKVSFVLHGPVIRDMLRQNYSANRELVNLAASLSALQVVEIKACRTWMGINGVEETQLQPFIVPVNLARSEVERLRKEEHYLDF